ncbi:MAG: methionyl-tRNA formyltransferase [Nonlabens sp.]
MKNSLRIVFYGTPEFATTILKTIHASHHEVAAVVTAPDKPAGRGRKLNQSHVKQYALENNLPVLQPKNLKSTKFIVQLDSYKADCQVIVAFRMLPEIVWSMPALGTFNLHASLLPNYRGAAPINWAIINQEKVTGVTTFFIDENIDTGTIIDQSACAIASDENVGSLYNKLMNLGADLTVTTLDRIATGEVASKKQEVVENLRHAPKLDHSNTLIDFNKTATEVDALVRGLFPFPVAKARLQNQNEQTIKVFKTEVIEKSHRMPPGSIVIIDQQIHVACKEGMISLVELQLPNKKRMTARALLNGFKFMDNAIFLGASEQFRNNQQ